MSHRLSIIVPVYNEERTLLEIMHALAAKCPDAQMVYVDDGSKDRSLEILHANARPHDIVLTKPNGGKGSAICLGLTRTTGDFTVIQDADLEYDPAQIAMLVDEAMKHQGSAVFGSRFLQSNPNIYKIFLLGNKFLTWFFNLLYGTKLTDSYTCYKLLPTHLFQSLNLTSRGFELEAEICAKCAKKGIPIRELPISYRPRTIEEGKKINWKDAWKGVSKMVGLRIRIKENT
jgi:glycosyltransferase involved in cell wall biosynthesis